MKAIPASEVIASSYQTKMAERKALYQQAQTNAAKAGEEVQRLRQEVLKSIRGESAFPQELLVSLLQEAEERQQQYQQQLKREEENCREDERMLRDLRSQHDTMISWAELFETSSMSVKKMVIANLIRRIDVYRGYQLHIDFRVDLSAYQMETFSDRRALA